MIGRGGVTVDATVLVVALVAGTAALALATIVATRRDAPDRRTPRGTALAPLVPWLGTVLALVLLVRGATIGAAVVVVATLVHAGVTRARASSRHRRRVR